MLHSEIENPKIKNIRKILEKEIEIHRIESNEIHIAERIRFHLMDSGIRIITKGNTICLKFSLRAQQSDFKGFSNSQLFDQIYEVAKPFIEQNGFHEINRRETKKTNPSNLGETLDTWFEIDFQKEILEEEKLKSEIKSALQIEKCIRPLPV